LEYMDGLQGQTKTRTVADAKQRALWYKEYEKTNTEVNEKKESNDEKEEVTKEAVDDEDDKVRWKRLDDHEKRKEYKRARKVLDVLQ
jgi:hypothetical protein